MSLNNVSGFNLLTRRTLLLNTFLIPGASKSVNINNSLLYNTPSDYEDNGINGDYNNDNLSNENMNSALIKKRNPNNARSIYFTGEINEETCFKLYEALIKNRNIIYSDEYSQPHIDLYIQSPGGSLLPALGLSDEIKSLGVPVHTYIRGYAASAATLLSVVGARRYMYNHSVYMIHGLKYGSSNNIEGLIQAKDLNTNTEILMNIIKDIYLKNSNMDEKVLDDMFLHDIWMNAETTLKYGLIDYIL
tara:strand:- start:1049 stop:1789 length:741 start_codon:yes stop_codon:yes gene_type:complete